MAGQSLPSDEAIRARAEQLGLLEPGADLLPAHRRRIGRLLQEEAIAPPAAAEPPHQLLSRFTHETTGGILRVDVVFIPHPEKDPSNG